MKSTEKLNTEICNRFRNAINESPSISKEAKLSALYNLSCAVMDRLDSSVKYLNAHWDFPDSEEEFLCFVMFACILNDGIDMIYRRTIEEAEIDGRSVKIYDRERTICDLLLHKNKVDGEVYNIAIQRYIRDPKKMEARLMKYAKLLHVEKKVREILGIWL